MNQLDLIEYLTIAAQHGASDLHLTAGSPAMARVNGALQPLTGDLLDAERTRTLILDVLKETQRSELEKTWQLDFSLEVEGLGRYRGNACYVAGAVEANLRFIPQHVTDLGSLGHSPVVEDWCRMKAGLILICGASGAGKTTTMASMVQTIARSRNVNIVTIEDPIEFVYDRGIALINQREIGSDARDFPEALRNALRQDADVIVVGEMRDGETIQTAVKAAETGHLVIGTMHTNDAPTAISRIIDAYPEENQRFVGAQLAWSLKGVVCQYLLPRTDQAGLVLATELMTVNTGVAASIRERRLSQLPSLIQIGAADGMHTVDDSLLELLLADRISLQDAMAYARDPDAIKTQFQTALKNKRKGWFGRVFSG
jgi:twitching motility protein PilT